LEFIKAKEVRKRARKYRRTEFKASAASEKADYEEKARVALAAEAKVRAERERILKAQQKGAEWAARWPERHRYQSLWFERSNVKRAARTLAYESAQVAILQAQCDAIAAAKSRALAKKRKRGSAQLGFKAYKRRRCGFGLCLRVVGKHLQRMAWLERGEAQRAHFMAERAESKLSELAQLRLRLWRSKWLLSGRS
jgi:hypothetical protein